MARPCHECHDPDPIVYHLMPNGLDVCHKCWQGHQGDEEWYAAVMKGAKDEP